VMANSGVEARGCQGLESKIFYAVKPLKAESEDV
jgi:hypothetical protein